LQTVVVIMAETPEMHLRRLTALAPGLEPSALNDAIWKLQAILDGVRRKRDREEASRQVREDESADDEEEDDEEDPAWRARRRRLEEMAQACLLEERRECCPNHTWRASFRARCRGSLSLFPTCLDYAASTMRLSPPSRGRRSATFWLSYRRQLRLEVDEQSEPEIYLWRCEVGCDDLLLRCRAADAAAEDDTPFVAALAGLCEAGDAADDLPTASELRRFVAHAVASLPVEDDDDEAEERM
jgi:hypothetical protein